MRTTPAGFALAVAMTAPLSAARVDPSSDRSIVVRVDDRAQVPASTLDRAGQEAARIYRLAGLKLLWTHASDAGGRFAVRLIILPRFAGAVAAHAPTLMGAAPVFTQECDASVYLFFAQIVSSAIAEQLDPSLVLGTVAAHEIGHVLLRHSGHSRDGLMRSPWTAGDWRRAASGLLLFSASEPETMRSTIAACQ